MKPSDIQIGTTYRIRQFEDMAAEYGVDNGGDIKYSGELFHFTQDMREICGLAYIPYAADHVDGACYPLLCGYEISAYMLEPFIKTLPAPPPTPTLRIGRFTLRRFDAKSIWIENEDGEGGQFSEEAVEAALGEMYKRYF